MIRYVIIFICLVNSFAISEPRIEGMIAEREYKTLTAGELYIVPQCKKLMLVGVKKYSDLTWLKIKGNIAVQSNLNGNAASHLIEGNFTYRTESGELYERIILQPGTEVLLLSKELVEKMEVMEYTWDYKKGSLCDQLNS